MSAVESTTVDDDTSNCLETFCTTLVDHSQWKSQRFLYAGSRMEIPNHHLVAQMFGVNMDKLDMDKMQYVISRVALCRSQQVPEAYTDEIVRIYTEGTHAGYVRLIKEKDNTELLYSEWRLVGDGQEIHGPAVIYDARKDRTNLFEEKYKLSNYKLNEDEHQRLTLCGEDIVWAVHSPYWPKEAAEWVTRARARGFPSRSVIKQVVRYGCDLVPVSHKFGDPNDYRFSFSKAELLINKSYTASQRVVYETLWLINKSIDCKYTCTYYVKTLMLWACKEKPLDFWEKTVLNNSVCELLIHLMACLKLKYCVNYFIPANNMMDHLVDTCVSSDIETFWKYLNLNLSTIKLIPANNMMDHLIDSFVSNDIEAFWKYLYLNLFRPTIEFAIQLNVTVDTLYITNYELPAWVKRAVVIYDQINNEEDNFMELYQTKSAPDLLKELRVELFDIYNSIHLQLEAVSCGDVSVKQVSNLILSEIHLTRAIGLWESDERDTLTNCNHVTVRSIVNAYMLCSRAVTITPISPKVKLGKRKPPPDTNDCNDTKCFKSETTSENNLTASNKIEITANSRCEVKIYKEWPSICEVKIYKEWPGKSPTVNISWFIAKSYLANLYYVTNRDVTLTLKTCDDVINVYKLSYMNERHAERAFPVILSTDWAGIYDKEIQELIGFYSLCSYVMNRGNNRSVYLGVCPVLFVMYIKLRIAFVIHVDDWEPSRQHFYDHLKHSCKCDIQVNNGRAILLEACRNSEKKRKKQKHYSQTLQALHYALHFITRFWSFYDY